MLALIPQETIRLPSRWRRLGGFLIDGLIVGGLYWGISRMTALPDWQSEDIVVKFLAYGISFTIWLLANWIFLIRGQTIGKALFGVKVVMLDDTPVTNRVFMLFRYGVLMIFTGVPVVGPAVGLAECCLIFGEPRRCLHDYVAGTKVVFTIPPRPRQRFLDGMLAFLIPLALLSVLALNSPGAKMARGDYDGAIAAYSYTIKRHPQDAKAYLNRGNAKKAKGDLAGAIADFTKAIELEPTLTDAYTNRGNAKKSQGNLAGADADFAQAAKLQGR